MDLTEVKIAISPNRELIPINENLTNFHSEFKVVSSDRQPFSAIIINQTALDTIPEDGAIEMRLAPKGIFSGEITENGGTFDHWYIAIKADKEGEAVVSIKTVEVDEAVLGGDAEAVVDNPQPKTKGMSTWIIALIVVIILIAGYFIVKHFFLGPTEPAGTVAPSITSSIAPTAPIVDDFTIDVSDLPPI